MTNNLSRQPRLTLNTPAAYLIRFRGRVDQNWLEYFDRFLVVVSVSPGRARNHPARPRARSSRAAGDAALSVLPGCGAGLGGMSGRV